MKRLMKPIIVASLFALFLTSVPPPENVYAAFDNEPARKVEIVIQASKIDANLSDFPVLLTEDNIPSEACDADGTYPAQDGGGDIRFTSDANGNNRLAIQVVDFNTDNNPANCTVEIWVKVPTLSGTTDTSIWMWYHTATSDSQPSASDPYGSRNVWNGNYAGVWHMNESGGSRADSTANANNLTDNNTVGSGVGPWHTAADFESSSSESLSVSDTSSLSVANDFTYSGWIKLESFPSGGAYTIMSKWGTPAATQEYLLSYSDTSSGQFRVVYTDDGIGYTDLTYNTVLSTGVWYHVALTVDVSAQSATLFLNGVSHSMSLGNNQDTSMQDGTGAFSLGARSSGVDYFDGLIDESSVSNVIRSAEWIDAGFENQSDPAAFAIEQAVQDGFTAPNEQFVIKSSNESVSSSTTLQNDDEITFVLAANTEYIINGGIFATSTSAQPDIKIAFSVPAGARMDIAYFAQGGNTRTAELLETSGVASDMIAIPANQNTIIQTFGSVVTGSTGGTLQFTWTQNTSNASATTVKQGSFMSVSEAAE